jgi:predicted amidohydrolase YtcJ
MPESHLAILNANIITLNPAQPKAQAVLIRGGKIEAVGSNRQIRKQIDTLKTRILDAHGATIVPGLTDCHVHMTGFGRSLRYLDLRDVRSIGEIQRKLRARARRSSEEAWIVGGGWDQERLAEARYPTRWDLDSAISDRPVFLRRVCGHVAVANTKALQFVGVTKQTRIEGGQIDADPQTGEPNGVVRENALEHVSKAIPGLKNQDLENICLEAAENAVQVGLTCVHWLVDSSDEIHALQNLRLASRLPLRVVLGISVGLLDSIVSLGLQSGFGDDMLKLGFLKILADGSLGGHTAALERPYSDRTDTKGMMLYTTEELESLVSKAHKTGLQVGVHAIGDRAVREVVDTYDRVLERLPRRDHRHRIEHASVLNPKLIKRIKRLHLILAVQPHFTVSDFWTQDRLGRERMRWTYPFKTLFKENIRLASSSDCPVENISPFLGIWAATTRKSPRQESLTVEEALETYTANAAYASFDEHRRGTIEVGKLADLTVLSGNVLDISPERIRTTRVEMTIVGGKIVYSRRKDRHRLRHRA